MRIVLITTTIRVPKVLELYRQIGPDVIFLVAGDRKTPHEDVKQLMKDLGNAIYYSDEDQKKFGYSCSDVIGWNSVQRRNVVLLEAMKLRPDIVVTIDDDNIPMNHNYFADFESAFKNNFSGLNAVSETGWFNIGAFLEGHLYHRGFPYELKHVDLRIRLEPKSNIKIGVVAGLWLGDPDIDAIERIERRPVLHQISEALQDGLVVDSNCFAPFNSQNTAYLSKVAPLMVLITEIGRYDDIWAAYISERIMRESGYHVLFGKPFVWQERNSHNLLEDLKNEIFGMEYTRRFCNDLLAMDLGKGTMLDKLFRLFELIENLDYLPPIMHKLGKYWCKDIESVM